MKRLLALGALPAVVVLMAGCGAAKTAARTSTPDTTVAPRAAAPTTAAPTTAAPTTAAPRKTPVTSPPSTAPAITAPAVPTGSTEIAVLKVAAPGSAAPGGPATVTVPSSWHGAVSSLPVIAQKTGWLEVRLAQRPNESTAWIPAADATLATSPDRIVVNLGNDHVELFVNNVMTESFPAGIGTPSDPTPIGKFFVAFFASPPNAGYGPFVIVTSAHSNSITDWESSGDAIIALHGPIDEEADTEIGTTGAAISHGCVRLHDSDLAQLRNVPAGSPVDVIG